MSKNKTPIEYTRYSPRFDIGLNSSQVDERKTQGLANITKDVNKRGYLGIIAKNLLTFFNLVYAIITFLLITAKEYNLFSYVFLIMVVLNTLISTIQEINSKRVTEKLRLLSAPTVTVMRESVKKEVKVEEIVLDDIMLLSAGKQITADAILVDGEVEVNEAQLTGESIAIRKIVGSTLLSGSFVVSGNCYAQVERVGNENQINKLAAQAKQYKQPKSGILGSLNLLLKVVSIILIISGVWMFARSYPNFFSDLFKGLVDKEKYADTITSTSTALIGMIPQGLYLMTTLALAMGVIRLSKSKTLVQDIYCIEMLARVDVLCLDKTGTITDGTMVVARYIEFQRGSEFNIKDIISSMNGALHESNMTSKALETYFGVSSIYPSLEVTPFSSDRKYSAVTFKSGTYLLGAPEFVLKNNFEKYASEINDYANQGFRVLALAHSNLPLRDGRLQKLPKLLALILIEDHIRKEAYDTIKYFKDNGVQVKVISGDNPVTVSEVSKRVGIENAEEYISLDGMSDDEVYQVANSYTVFGRVKPNQKQIIVKALKDAKRTVAMTGDGVNDILALKEADCSIAMASGSEAVRSVAKLVLLDSNFASLPKVVNEGRRVINNVQQTSMLFFVKTLFIILLAALTLTGFTTVFHPTGSPDFPISNPMNLFVLEFFAIGIPAFFLALQPNTKRVKGNFLANALKKALPGALAVVIEVMIIYGLARILDLKSFEYGGHTFDQVETIVVICATATSFMVLYMACQPFSLKKTFMFLFVTLTAFTIFYFATTGGLSFGPFQFRLAELCRVEDGKLLDSNGFMLTIILSLLSYVFITSITYVINIIDTKVIPARQLKLQKKDKK